MKEDIFVAKNLEKWHKLEEYNNKLLKKGVSGLSVEEIKDFAGLYRNLSHHLSYARTHFKGSNIVLYLNQIISVSHNYIFTREKKELTDFKYYISRGLPLALNANGKYILSAFAAFMLGFVFCLILVLVEPVYSEFFFPGVEVSALNLNPTGDESWAYGLLSSFIMTNNIKVSFLALALGVTAGIGTVYVLFYNGMSLGALTAIVISGGADLSRYFAMLLPHGFLELAAIFISGGAGLIIGKALLSPGTLKRRDAAVKASKEAAYLIPTVVIMLTLAGIIEGFFTPLGINHVFKLIFAFISLFLIISYYIIFLKRAKEEQGEK